jgi:subtilase-type serine protease
VGLRDWPKAMVPSSAMRVTDDLDNLIVRHPLREGQPILAVQLGRADAAAVEAVARPLAVASPTPPPSREPERDLWEATLTASASPITTPPAITTPPTAPVATVTTVSTTFAAGTTTASPQAQVTTTPTTSNIPTTPTADPVPAAVVASVPRPEPVAPTAPVVSAPIATTAPTVEPQPTQDPRALEADAPTARIALAIAPPAPQATVEATPAVADAGSTPSSPLRNPLRPRSSVIQALAVPNRSALTDEIATRSEAPPAGLSSRVTAATAVAERSVTVRDTAAEAPRMLPSGSDTSVAPAATTAQAPRAPQPRPATTRATATAPATRSARAQSFNKGYRPN